MVDLVIYSSSLSKKNKPSASDSGLTKGACPKISEIAALNGQALRVTKLDQQS